jgi:hypothetical protein
MKENATYRLAEVLVRLSKLEFPMHLNETTHRFFETTSVNRRMLPDETIESASEAIQTDIADSQVTITLINTSSVLGIFAVGEMHIG